MTNSSTYKTPARVLACPAPTFNQVEVGIASNWAEVEALLAAMPAHYRFSCLRPVSSKSVNDSFRTDEDYRGFVNPRPVVDAVPAWHSTHVALVPCEPGGESSLDRAMRDA